MSWLDAIRISALIIMLSGMIGIGIVSLMIWAMKRNRDLEMFIAIVIVMMWITFTLVLHKTG